GWHELPINLKLQDLRIPVRSKLILQLGPKNSILSAARDPDRGEDRIGMGPHEPEGPPFAEAVATVRHQVKVLKTSLDEWRRVIEPGPLAFSLCNPKGRPRFSEGAEHQVSANQPVVVGQTARKARRSGVQQQPRALHRGARDHDDLRWLFLGYSLRIQVDN